MIQMHTKNVLCIVGSPMLSVVNDNENTHVGVLMLCNNEMLSKT